MIHLFIFLYLLGFQPVKKISFDIYYESCLNTTLRFCKWNSECVRNNVKYCEKEAKDFSSILK